MVVTSADFYRLGIARGPGALNCGGAVALISGCNCITPVSGALPTGLPPHKLSATENLPLQFTALLTGAYREVRNCPAYQRG